MDQTMAATLLELQPDVDPGFLRAHEVLFLAAVVEDPGVDSVRAAVLRDLEAFGLTAERREEVLQGAARALRSFPEAVASGDPMQLMARHPAWVGLAHLELVERLDGDAKAALEVAGEHARLGFSAAANGPVQLGETFWALAETAEDVGWTDRVKMLLEEALQHDFADDGARDQVLLLLGTLLAADDASRSVELLSPVVLGDGDPPTRAQSAFVLARIAEGQNDLGGALSWLEQAHSIVTEAGDLEVALILQGEIDRLAPPGAGQDTP